jgi:hypothetical protein
MLHRRKNSITLVPMYATAHFKCIMHETFKYVSEFVYRHVSTDISVCQFPARSRQCQL